MIKNLFLKTTLFTTLCGVAFAVDAVEIFPAKKELWKQCGPGSFSVQEGVATSEGGMGMWWYSGKAYANATIDIEFSLPDPKWNSGIFVRFPDPGNDPWVAIRQGYECQVSGADKADKLTTGSIYDIQAASHISLKKPGEWNSYQITTFGDKIIIAINGELVNVFTAQKGRGDQKGFIGLQNHDPNSKVSYRKVSVTEWGKETTLDDVLEKVGVSRADWAKYNAARNPGAKWFDKMDIGPVWATVFDDHYQGQKRLAALKGLRMQLSHSESILGLFDTETLRMSSAFQGGVIMSGTPWTGQHGGINRMDNVKSPIMQTSVMPGWADKAGSFEDKREHKGFSNLAKDHARFNGHFRHGEQLILDYSVLGSRVLDRPFGEVVNGQPMVFRQLDLAPCDHERVMLVADDAGSSVTLDAKGTSALIGKSDQAQAPTEQADVVSVVMDRSEGAWGDLAMGAPSDKDPFDFKVSNKARFRVIPGFVQTHAKGGDEEGIAVRLNDGLAARSDDDVEQSFFFDDQVGIGRLEMDLGSPQDIGRIHLYSHHRGDRAPQNVEIYGAESDKADPALAAGELEKGGWKRITGYSTKELGDGGKQGVAVLSPKGSVIGKFHKILIVSKPGHDGSKMHTFFSEIDVYGKAAPALQPKASGVAGGISYCIQLKGDGLKLSDGGNGSVLLRIPASKNATRVSLGYATNQKSKSEEVFEALASALPAPRELESLTHGGPALYPDVVEAAAKLGAEQDIWAVDTIGLPLNNPWFCEIKPGGMDLFSDGDSAAISTWNGDVWVVKGLKGDWNKVQWRRFASGLYESLGLKIVDDVIYVNGRDQITRLHDRNKDGEADWYECFNNDVIVTSNFHEFTFSLQTDKEGNFYIVKGAPVLSGGRGFDKILPHNGTVMKISKDGNTLEVLATGLRAPGGMAVGPNGEITTGENEGTWQPCCKLNYFTGKDKFLGVEDAAHALKGQAMYPPLCYLPMRVDNSGGGQVWVPEGVNWGIKAGELIHLSYGQSALYRVLRQEVDGLMQGGVVRIPLKLDSSAMRARFQNDGSLYVLGFRGWQTNAALDQGFHRIRYTGKELTIPDKLEATDKGIYIRFEKKLDAAMVADRFNFKVERWKYMRTRQYGSGEYSIDNPDLAAEERAHHQETHQYRKHDAVEVSESTVLPDGKTVFLRIPSMKPAEQMSITYKLKFADGSDAVGEVINTVHKLATDKGEVAASSDKEGAGATLDALKPLPGLHQTISRGGKTDHRVSRLPAQFNMAGDAVSDMLGKVDGAYSSTWTGYLCLNDRVSPDFSFQGTGNAELKIDGESILSEQGELGKKSSGAIKLDPGAHLIEISYQGAPDGSGHFRLLWKGEEFPVQSIPASYFKHAPNEALAKALTVRHGRDVLAQQNCIQCHSAGDGVALPEATYQGPDLKGIGSRVSQSWLSQWIASPHSLKPGTTMPAFVDDSTEQGRKDAADIAAYLATLKGDVPADVPAKADDAKLGGGHFHNLGCVACHSLPDQAYDAQTKRVSLNNINGKFTVPSLVDFLKQPEKHHAAIKMPNFRLSDDEARQLAAFLHTGSAGKGNQPHAAPAGDATRGSQLVAANNCASCHSGMPASENKLPAFADILGTSWKDHGCVSAKKPSKTPALNLTDADRASLEAYRVSLAGNATETLQTVSSFDFAARQLKSLNCAACHEQDDVHSLLDTLHNQSLKFTDGVPQDEHHKIDQSRPSLTFAGEMLHSDYLENMLAGSVAQRPRPWLSMRMPSFASRAKLLGQGLASQHGMPPSKSDAAKIDQDKVKIGHKLIGSNGGFACTICHGNGAEKPLAAFEVEGINFDQVGARLRPGYYHRWMDNPQSVTPTTKMPRYTQKNKSPLPDYDGDAQKQFDAILEYFKTIEKK